MNVCVRVIILLTIDMSPLWLICLELIHLPRNVLCLKVSSPVKMRQSVRHTGLLPVHSHNTHSAPMNAFFIVCLLLNLLWLQSVSTQVTTFVSLIHPPVYLLNDIFSELSRVVLILSGYCTLRALVTQAMHPSLVQFFQVIPNMVRKSSRVIVAAASRRPSSRWDRQYAVSSIVCPQMNQSCSRHGRCLGC